MRFYWRFRDTINCYVNSLRTGFRCLNHQTNDMKSFAEISPRYDIVQMNHLTFFTNAHHLYSTCTLKTQKGLKQVQMKMTFEVFSNLICNEIKNPQAIELLSTIGERLSNSGTKWECIHLKPLLGAAFVFENIRLVQKRLIKKNGESKIETTGWIKCQAA